MFVRRWWLILTILVLWMAAGCMAQGLVTPATIPASAPPMAERLTAALVARDADALQALMDDPFRLAIWGGEGRMLSATDALAELQVFYLEPAYTLVMGDRSEAAALLGADPTVIWSPEVQATDALVVRGMGVSGADEAVFIIGQDARGREVWSGMIVAPGGFPTPVSTPQPTEGTTEDASANEAAAASATPHSPAIPTPLAQAAAVSTTKALVLQTANVYAQPAPSSDLVGLLSVGVVVDVVTTSSDGAWLRIVCPPGAAGDCWISADPATARPVATPVSEAAQDLPPTLTPAFTALPPTATPTATRLPPTPTAQVVAPERITFAPGAVSATRTGFLQTGQPKEYLLRVQAGQTMTIDLRSADLAANFAVTGVNDRQPYKRIVDESRVWSLAVPSTQDYLITIMTTAPVEYSLLIVVPPAPATATPPAPLQRITFAPGASSATLMGTLPPNGQQGYLLRAVVGQTMFVVLSSPGDGANFAVSGYNSGEVLKPLTDPVRAWSGRLPSTQDYLVRVVNPTAGSLSYTLVVSFSPLGRTPAPPPSPPQRISFPAGGTSATVGGPIASGSVQQFVLRALAGQTMQVTVTSPTDTVYLGVRGANGDIYQQFAQGLTSWTGVLPDNQDYLLAVYNAGGNTTFSLTVIVE